MHLIISLRGDENDSLQSDAYGLTIANLRDTCKKLCLNNLELLVVDIFNGTPSRERRLDRYSGQECLELLKMVRSDKVWGI